ncbi:collagen alpha-1(I) chain-like [Canis lupus dingo]|uniref:collagen alpha-1(I) chain-like n=1 Tax=Canis lupus dingo TaxID=286419 RepID=UPI0020C3E9AA|nr:collagen alpha-1(I) chain-like [Canis lupus dingo]
MKRAATNGSLKKLCNRATTLRRGRREELAATGGESRFHGVRALRRRRGRDTVQGAPGTHPGARSVHARDTVQGATGTYPGARSLWAGTRRGPPGHPPELGPSTAGTRCRPPSVRGDAASHPRRLRRRAALPPRPRGPAGSGRGAAHPRRCPRPSHGPHTCSPLRGPPGPAARHPHPGSPPEASPRSPVVTWSATAPPLHRMCVTSPSRPGSARKAAGIWKGECCCGGGREAPMVREGESWSTEVTMVGNRKNGDSEVGIHQRNTDPGILFCLMSERWSLKISAVLKRIPRKERDVGICFSGYWDDSCRG